MTTEADFIQRLSTHFPNFAKRLTVDKPYFLEKVLPPATPEEIARAEAHAGVPLPASYKLLLSCASGFWLKGGSIKFGSVHLFYHSFKPLDQLTAIQQETVRKRGGHWPPPSQGMLCFADYFLMADGDQLLFDISRPLPGGEYPIMYYDHEASPAAVHELSRSFIQFIETLLDRTSI